MPFSSILTISPAEAIILSLLQHHPMYGYELIKTVGERTDGVFSWKEGTLYPCLHRLEKIEAIESDWQDGPYGKPRKYYTITRTGLAMARDMVNEWRAFSRAMDAALF